MKTPRRFAGSEPGSRQPRTRSSPSLRRRSRSSLQSTASGSTPWRRDPSGRRFSQEAVSLPATLPGFGADTPMGRPGQPAELAPLFVPLASNEPSYSTGQVWRRGRPRWPLTSAPRSPLTYRPMWRKKPVTHCNGRAALWLASLVTRAPVPPTAPRQNTVGATRIRMSDCHAEMRMLNAA